MAKGQLQTLLWPHSSLRTYQIPAKTVQARHPSVLIFLLWDPLPAVPSARHVHITSLVPPDPCLGSVCLHPQPSWFGFKGYLLGWGALIIPSKMTCDPLCSPPLSCPSFSPAPAPVCLSMCCRLLPVGSAPGPGGDARLLRNLRAWNSHVRSKVG